MASPVHVAPGASHKPDREKLGPVRTQWGKRATTASRPLVPRLAHLHFVSNHSRQASREATAPQLSSAHARSRRPASSPSLAFAPPPRSKRRGAGKEEKPLSLRPLLRKLAQKQCACATPYTRPSAPAAEPT